MMKPPRIEGAPGHRWQPRADGKFVCLWIARRDFVKNHGYSPKTQRIWPPTTEPDAVFDKEAELYIQSQCLRLQDDMHAFIKGRAEPGQGGFVGTIDSLIECFKTDADSDYQKIRFKSRKTYDSHLRMVSKTVGQRLLSKVTGRDVKRWFESWSADGLHIPRAHYRMTMFRLIISFGSSILEDAQCKRLRLILSDLEFEQGRSRTEVITAEHAIGVRMKARAAGAGSIALAQAFQFDLMLRQKDVIGEWIPMSEPGISAIIRHGDKWLFGIDWNEVSDGFVLKHRLSKSIRGKRAITNQQTGKVKEYDLHLYPMVMEELALTAGCAVQDLRRDMFPVSGPIIVQERVGTPYAESTYREQWRKYATAAGVPKHVQNRDSRAGAATEAEEMGMETEMIQKAMGHSKPDQTRTYTRAADAMTAKVAKFRSEKRNANTLTNK